jgi:hypothetical protein
MSRSRGLLPLLAAGGVCAAMCLSMGGSTSLHAPTDPQTETKLLADESEAATSLGDLFQTTSTNAEDVAHHFFDPFFPALQQETVDRLDLISQFPEDPTKFFTFIGDVAKEMQTGLEAHFAPFYPLDGDESDVYGSINDAHHSLYENYSDALGDDSFMQSSLDFLASPMSGVLAGIFTPYIGAGLALVDDTTDVVQSLGSLDVSDAFQAALNEPVDFLDAFFNGYGEVDIPSTPVSAFIPGSDSDDTITSINLGGLFSTGGSLFNSLGIDGDDSSVSGEGFGEFGSLVSLQEGIAEALGWNGEGNPIDALSDVDGFGWLGNLLNGIL